MPKKKSEITGLIPQGTIENKIFLFRGKKVMIDRDLAKMYGVETRVLNQAVKRNIERFPDDFMFSLTRQEIMNLSQIVIGSKIKHAPNVFAFTELGVAMLSSVLNSKKAIMVNIQIMRAFTKLKKMVLTHKDLKKKIEGIEKKMEKKFTEHDQHFKIIFEAINQLLEEPVKKQKKIGY